MILVPRKDLSLAKKRLRKRQGERKEFYFKIHEEIRRDLETCSLSDCGTDVTPASLIEQVAGPPKESTTQKSNDGDSKLHVQQRESLPMTILDELVRGIISNRTSAFGLGKLYKYNLNESYPFPVLQYPAPDSNSSSSSREIEWRLPPSYRGVLPCNRMTLMLFAILWNRDDCIASFLRAGCNPVLPRSLRQPNTPTMGIAVKEQLHLSASILNVLSQIMQPSIAVWILKLYFRMKLYEYCRYDDEGLSDEYAMNVCSLCQIGPSLDSDCSQVILQLGSPCNHRSCEDCYWRSVVKQYRANKYDDVHCPVCCLTLSPSPRLKRWHVDNESRAITQIYDLIHCSVPTTCDMLSENIATIMSSQQSQLPSMTRELSLAKFLVLPISLTDPVSSELLSKNTNTNTNGNKCKPKKDRHKFLARPYSSLVGVMLGSTQAQRCLELMKAASSGNALRIRALVHVGIDLNYANEYGQTASFLAAWKGHVNCFEVIRQCGGDVTLPDNAGVSPGEVTSIIRSLRIKGEDEDIDVEHRKVFLSENPDFLLRSVDSTCCSAKCLIAFDDTHPGAGSLCLDNLFSEAFLTHLDQLAEALPIAPPEKFCCSDRAYYCDVRGVVCKTLAAAITTTLETHFFPMQQQRIRLGCQVFQHMRYLFYRQAGGSLAPHVDLSRTDDFGCTSTHTFILYLTDCRRGGSTVLLKSVKTKAAAAVQLLEPSVGTGTGAGATTGPDVFLDDLVQLIETGGISLQSPIDSNQSQSVFVEPQKIDKTNREGDRGETGVENPDDPNVLAVVHPRRGRLLLFPHVCPHAGQIVAEVPKILLRGEVYLQYNTIQYPAII